MEIKIPKLFAVELQAECLGLELQRDRVFTVQQKQQKVRKKRMFFVFKLFEF